MGNNNGVLSYEATESEIASQFGVSLKPIGKKRKVYKCIHSMSNVHIQVSDDLLKDLGIADLFTNGMVSFAYAPYKNDTKDLISQYINAKFALRIIKTIDRPYGYAPHTTIYYLTEDVYKEDKNTDDKNIAYMLLFNSFQQANKITQMIHDNAHKIRLEKENENVKKYNQRLNNVGITSDSCKLTVNEEKNDEIEEGVESLIQG